VNCGNDVASFSRITAGSTRGFLALKNATAGFTIRTDAAMELNGFRFAAGTASLSPVTLV
jgi:hypothetical protein